VQERTGLEGKETESPLVSDKKEANSLRIGRDKGGVGERRKAWRNVAYLSQAGLSSQALGGATTSESVGETRIQRVK